MNSNKTFRTTRWVLALIVISIPALAASDKAEPPSFKSEKVTDNIWLLQGKGGNVAVLTGDDGLLMVDDDYRAMSGALKLQLERFGGPEKLTYIINTHWHADHTEGNLMFGDYAPIVAHDNVRTRLLTAQEIKLFKTVSKPYPEIATPSITFKQSVSLHVNGEQVNVVHFPNGHTDGDAIVFFKKANVVHMGDHYFAGTFPFVDLGTGGNVLQMAANVKSVLAQIGTDTKVIPGHGPLSTKADLDAFYAMLVGTVAEVKAMKAEGLTLKQMQAKGLSGRWQVWAKGFVSVDLWISFIDGSL